MKQRRSHIVMLCPPARKTLDGGEDLSQEFGGGGETVGAAKLLQPLDSELLSLAVKGRPRILRQSVLFGLRVPL